MMRKDKLDKQILCNENLQEPSPSVLNAAKAEMRKNSTPARKRLAPSKIVAIATACVAVVVVICCIPFMMPFSDDNFNKAPSSSAPDGDKIAIDSIENFNQENDQSILTFSNVVSNSSYLYKYNEVETYCSETYIVDEITINLLVKLTSNNKEIYHIEESFMLNLRGCQITEINGCVVQFNFRYDTYVFVQFEHNDYNYMIEMQGETSSWENILENFIK